MEDHSHKSNSAILLTEMATAIDRFTAVSARLSTAITPCISGVVTELHAKGLIGFGLKDELISGTETNARKADKLVNELERSLGNDQNPDQYLENMCSVLSSQRERQLDDIVRELSKTVN